MIRKDEVASSSPWERGRPPTVCFFGHYDPDYGRVQVLKMGLAEHGYAVVECRSELKGWRRYVDLWRRHRRLASDYDYLLVAVGGYDVVWLARLLTRKPILFDAFVSVYLTAVCDRSAYRAASLRGLYCRLMDRIPCRLADRVLIDTDAQRDFFVEKYGIPASKFVKVVVGANPEIYSARERPPRSDGKFRVHWHGYIVPFHGVETILEAARLVRSRPEIEFRLVTTFNGKTRWVQKRAEEMALTNVFFLPAVSQQKLAEQILDADLCLGVFGSNPKAQLVVPNKLYECLACGRPIITAELPAIKEVVGTSGAVALCAPSSASALAAKILELSGDARQLELLSGRARALGARLTPERVVGPLAQVLAGLGGASAAVERTRFRNSHEP
jgi:glycosyltransferase involved in cell wall biosynthesis